MPFTLAHPAAVLPLKRFCPQYLIFPALVAGSLAPDAPYFIFQWTTGGYAHTLPGMLFVSLPIGLGLFWLFSTYGQKATQVIPFPHNEFVTSWISQPKYRDAKYWMRLVVSLAIGILTHVVWDSFTHSTGWVVNEAPILSTEITQIGRFHLHLYKLLQHGSTVVGLLLLAIAYARNFKRFMSSHIANPDQTFSPSTTWSIIVLGPLIAASIVTLTQINSTSLHFLIARSSIYYVDFLILFVVGAVVIKRFSQPQS